MSASPRVGVIGGMGRMGSWFAQLFSARGWEVSISDLNGGLPAPELYRRSDVVIYSVPIGATPKLIREHAAFARTDQMISDLTSIKSGVIAALLETPSEILSIHPMYGPHARTMSGQTVVMCKARPGRWTPLIEEFFRAEGAKLIDSGAEEHDRMMAVIQGLTHFSAITLARCLQNMGIDIQKTLQFTSPIYKVRMDMVGRIMAQDPALYAEIEVLNPYAYEAIEKLNEASRELSGIVASGSVQEFVRYFEEAARHMGPFKESALAGSNALLEALSKPQVRGT